MKKLKLGELFAGYGGLGMAVEQVFDAELAWYAEFDDAPSKIMEHHWPGVPNHRDVTTVDWSQVEPVDIISGGSPCQDLSAAGRRKGMTEGTRSNLWVSMREAIATIKPTYVVWENVRGAFSAKATSEMESCPGCVGADGGGRQACSAGTWTCTRRPSRPRVRCAMAWPTSCRRGSTTRQVQSLCPRNPAGHCSGRHAQLKPLVGHVIRTGREPPCG